MNREELGKLILESQEMLYRIAKTILYSDEDCSDALQETIVRAFDRLDTLKKKKYAKTWLVRILMNECMNILRKNQRTIPLDEAVSQQERSFQQDSYTELYEALMQLPEKMRLAVTLHYMEGYSVKETAELLGTSTGAVKSSLMRARKWLRKELGDGEEVYGV